MNKLFLYFIAGILFSTNLFAQKPNINYPGTQTLYIGKSITPIKINNTGGQVPQRLSPQLTGFLQYQGGARDFVKLPSGDIFLINYTAITRIKPDGRATLFAGNNDGYSDGVGTAARFGELEYIANDADGNLYVSDPNGRDWLNSRIRKITPAGVVTTFATGIQGPQGIAVDANGVVYVAEGTGRILKITQDGNISLLAGQSVSGAQDGVGANATFNTPRGLAIDKQGNIFVADFDNSLIRKITPDGKVTTVAGSKKNESVDGTGTAASFYNPYIIRVRENGELIVGEQSGMMRSISPSGEVTTIADLYYTFYNEKGEIVSTDFHNNIVNVDGGDNIVAYGGGGFYNITATGFSISPLLPSGLTFGADGTISGTPSVLSPQTTYKITGTNASGFSVANIKLSVVIPSDPPVITSFSPMESYPNAEITINGNFFTGATALTIGGKAVPYFQTTVNKITAYIPEGVKSGNITITTPRGTATLGGFTRIPAPKITAISPTSAWQGATVTITGTDFSNVQYVSFGGYNSSAFKIISPTQIEAVVSYGGSGDVMLQAPSGIGYFSGFTFVSPPSISSVSPSVAGGGSTVTINGNNFSNATSVKFGSVEADFFEVISDKQIKATVAAGSSNGVRVTTTAGAGDYSNFTFAAPPVVTNVMPLKGTIGTPVYIVGSGLDNAKVTIGGVPAIITYATSYQIYANIGTGAASGEIVIEAAGGKTTFSGLVVVQPPTITSFTPTSAMSGDKVVITGTNLSEVDYVTIGGLIANFTVTSATTIEATVGNYAASGEVRLQSEGGVASLAGFIFKGPTIVSFSPVNAAKGDKVVIKGTNFTGATGVDFGGVPATSYTVVSDTEISAVVGSGRSGYVSVTTPSGRGMLSGFSHPAPYIISYTPNYAGALSKPPITITGQNFTGVTAVSFGGVPAASFTIVSANTIIATPAISASGDVVVTGPDGTDKQPGFIWVQQPSITAFTPGGQSSGNLVTITGTNFTGVTGVKFGGIPAWNFYNNSSTVLSAYVGSGASGNIEVTTVGGTASISGFKYTNPSIESISPTLAAAGQTVTINGKSLGNIQSVKFGGVDAASFTIVSDEKITAVLSASGASGDVSISGSAGSYLLAGFTYLWPPNIYSCTPTEGGSETIVTIRGSNLLSTSEVKIGGTIASVIKVEANQVTVKVGSGSTGKIYLKTMAGETEFSGFTWYPAPTIKSVSPLTANAETVVTITGTNFDSFTALKFGGNYANIISFSSTQITAKPTMGASGDITLTTHGGTATFAGFKFLPAPVINSFTQTGEGADATVTLKGSNFTGVTGVSFGGVAAKSFTVVSATTITANPGTGATGVISVNASGGAGTIRGYLYIKPPALTSFAPASGPVGTIVTIKGDNFNTTAEKNIVYFGPLKAEVKTATKTQLEVIAPAAGTSHINVINTGSRLSAKSVLPFSVTNNINQVKFSNKLELTFKQAPGLFNLNDFDGDGRSDLLVVSSDSIYILRYGADPVLSRSAFKNKHVLGTNRQIFNFVVGDVDGDGKKDILFSMSPSVVVLRNTSTPDKLSFEGKTLENIESSTDAIRLADMDLDGRPDLVIGNDNLFYPNKSNGSTIEFGSYIYVGGTGGTISLGLSDIDGDGKPDPVTGSSYNGINVFKNNAVPGSFASEDFSGTHFYHPNYNYWAEDILLADVDGDGKPDLIENDYDKSNMLISLNTSTPGVVDASSFGFTKAISNNSMKHAITAVDMDGDGKIDLVSSSGTSRYYLRNQSTLGNISFVSAEVLTGGLANFSGKNVSCNDVDADGRVDMVFGDYENNKLIIFHNGPAVLAQLTKASKLSAGSGTEITLTGEHLDGATSVKFGNKAAKSFKVVSPQTIVAVVGEGESGNISVATPNGNASLPGFVFVNSPVITSATAAADGSGVLTITGTGFTGVTSVFVNGTQANTFTVNSDAKITATFPGISGELKVTNDAGTATLAAVTIKLKQVLSFASLPARIYGDADFDLPVTSNNPVNQIEFDTDKPGIVFIQNGKLQIIKAGTVTITATQPGDALNTDAVEVKQVLVINKKELQVKATPQSRQYGKVNPPLTFSYSGFVNGEDQMVLNTIPQVTTAANQQSPAGVYDILVTGGDDDNYKFVYSNAKLSITPATTTFKVAGTSITCKGEANGIINIAASQQANYTAVLTGNGLNKTYTFSAGTSIENLAPGSYSVCISDIALEGYQQCFEVAITEPKDLSVYTAVNSRSNSVDISLDGGEFYEINLNGIVHTTTENHITLPLSASMNNLAIRTNKPCQGIVIRVIDILGNTTPYPNPFDKELNIDLGEYVANNVSVKIYALNSGVLKLANNYQAVSGILTIDVAELGRGGYALHLVIDDKKFIYKVLK